MKTAIILHGMPPEEEYFDVTVPSPSNNHWLPWTQRQLLLSGILAQTPELPKPYLPNYENWKNVFEQFNLDEETMLIGHSCGAGFLVRWLSENNIKVGKVALVAPWIDPKKTLSTEFFNFHVDKDLNSKTQGIALFISSDDMLEVLESAKIITSEINQIDVKNFTGKGHFTLHDMKTENFQELLDFLLM